MKLKKKKIGNVFEFTLFTHDAYGKCSCNNNMVYKKYGQSGNQAHILKDGGQALYSYVFDDLGIWGLVAIGKGIYDGAHKNSA